MTETITAPSGIRCGHCRDRHPTVADVRACYDRRSRSTLPAPPVVPAPSAPAPAVLRDGIYTIPTDAGHRTFRVRTMPTDAKFAPGRQILSHLAGPDNNSDYISCGFVDRNALGWFVRPFRRYHDNVALLRDATAFLRDPDVALQEARCRRCGRRLTTVDSVTLGIGPECGSR